MKGKSLDLAVFDDLCNEIIKDGILRRMADKPRKERRNAEKLGFQQLHELNLRRAGEGMSMAAHPTTQRIIDKVVRDSKPPTLKSLFPGLGTRRSK